MLKLDNIYLNDSDSDKLADLLKHNNEGLPYAEQKTFQQLAEDLLTDAILIAWYKMKEGE